MAVELHLPIVQDADPTGLLNKYALPKVAMVVIAVAAAAGCLLSTKVGGDLGYLQAVARYLLLMGVGTAAGGLLWAWHVVLPSARLVGGPESQAYAVRQVRLFHRIQEASFLAACVGWAVLAPTYWRVWGAGRLAEHAVLLGSAALILLWGGYIGWIRGHAAAEATRAARSGFWGTFGAFLTVGLLLWASGFLQVWHDSPGQWQVLVWRVLHLSAFAAWFGGAVWNVSIAVRAARENLSLPVVIMANAQLERFRRIVRVALPLILATGLLQVWDYVGFTRFALEGPFGHFVIFKLSLIALLVVIFNTCPMWHACSPIAGMCNLDDLKSGSRG